MAWLSDWIRQIILILFIATFIDLLLPTSSLDRYVKMVMGLIIIMAILQPILQLVLHGDSWKKFSGAFSETSSIPTYATLDEIQAESRQMKATQQQEILHRFQVSIQDGVNEQVSQKFHVKVVSAEVKVGYGQDQTPEIKQISVVATKETSEFADQPIEPVQDVDVDADNSASIEPRQDRKLQQVIKKYLANKWDLEDNQVVVMVNSP